MSSPQVSKALGPVGVASRREGRRLGMRSAAIFLLVFAVYAPVFTGQFAWDDALLIDKNPLVTGQLGLRSIWFHTDIPLTLVAFRSQLLAWGNNPIGYHVVNVVLHAANGLLVWRVLARLKVRGAWFAAVLFAIHPVCVASVAWISELKNTLSLPFFLLSLLFYVAGEDEEVRSAEC